MSAKRPRLSVDSPSWKAELRNRRLSSWTMPAGPGVGLCYPMERHPAPARLDPPRSVLQERDPASCLTFCRASRRMDLLAGEKQTELECQLLRKASYPRRGVVESAHSTQEKEEALVTQLILGSSEEQSGQPENNLSSIERK